MRNFLFTAESVSEGHPDKIADQISDAILDFCISKDPQAKFACETLVTGKKVIIAGEVTSTAGVRKHAANIARKVIKEIGYIDPSFGLHYKDFEVEILLREQSPDIRIGVVHINGQIGAGDQGTMFGYAARETPQLMPLPITLAHELVRKQTEIRKSGQLPWLRPDAKSQVTIRYENYRPITVEKVVLSTQHSSEVTIDTLRSAVVERIIKVVIPQRLRSADIEYLVNPTGRFVIGGPEADTGLTGRKNIVDTYGGSCPHGGGSFSGKDPTKVDRSACYMARYIAKNIVASGIADRCTVQLAYAIGVVHPMSLMLDLHGTGKVDEIKLKTVVENVFPLTPKGIIESLDLLRPIYKSTSVYGHFGRELPEFTWERTDKAEDLKKKLRN